MRLRPSLFLWDALRYVYPALEQKKGLSLLNTYQHPLAKPWQGDSSRRISLKSSATRTCFLIGLLTCILSPVHGQKQEPNRAEPPFGSRVGLDRGERETASELYSRALMQVIPVVSKNYQFEAISENALAGRALLGLYRASKQAPPEALVRNTDHYFDTLPGTKLPEKLNHARAALSDTPLLRNERDIHASLRALIQTLDTFSNYADVDTPTRVTFESGAGMGFYLEDKPLGGSYFVRNVDIESPAHKQGIRPGDELRAINHVLIAPETSTGQVNLQLTLLARQRAGVALTLRNLQGTQKVVQISSIRQDLENSELLALLPDSERDTPIAGYRRLSPSDWDYWVDHSERIAIIRLGTIQNGASKVFEIVKQLQADGLKGLILDLRDCPSGVPSSTADVASYFLEQNSLITTMAYRNAANDDSRQFRDNSELRAQNPSGKPCLDTPLMVLIGPDTSGAAEMIAAALQDHERAKIVGERSRGKSTIQQVNSPERVMSNLYFSYRLTVGVFKRPSGKNLNKLPGATARDDWGVRPDMEVVLPAQVRRQVRAWWFEHDTRPLESAEASPIDDSHNDPVLQAALKALRK